MIHVNIKSRGSKIFLTSAHFNNKAAQPYPRTDKSAQKAIDCKDNCSCINCSQKHIHNKVQTGSIYRSRNSLRIYTDTGNNMYPRYNVRRKPNSNFYFCMRNLCNRCLQNAKKQAPNEALFFAVFEVHLQTTWNHFNIL